MQFYTVFLVIGVAVMAAVALDVQPLPIPTIENLNEDQPPRMAVTNYLSTNGYAVSAGQFPYHARLVIKNYNGSGSQSSGSLITPNYILTGGFGLQGNTSHGYAVLGIDYKSNTATQQQLNFTETGVHRHPIHSIATIRLDHPVTINRFVQPIRLPRLSDTRTYVLIEGTNVGSFAGPMRYLRNQVMANDDCQEQHPHVNVNSYHICTNTYVGGAFCSRAYGSGLIVEGENGPILVGITTASFGCNVNYPNVYLRVTVFRDWISMNSNYVFDF